jgi:hypothetical protein
MAPFSSPKARALNASHNVKVLVGRNTNAYIAMKSAPDLPHKNFTAMRFGPQPCGQPVAAKTIEACPALKFAVWGNHSPTCRRLPFCHHQRRGVATMIRTRWNM